MKSCWIYVPAFLLTACGGSSEQSTNTDSIEAPVAKKEEYIFNEHGNKRIDNYHWMRLTDDQKNAEIADEQTRDVLDYLNAENEYLKKKMAHTEGLQGKLYDEMVARLDPNEESVPVNENGYCYYDRYEEGQDYPLYCRKKLTDSTEEIILNGPELGNGQAYFEIGGYQVSPGNTLLVYGIDTVSRRNYTLCFKDLVTGKLFDDRIENTTGYAVWANDNKTVFYTKRDPQTLRDCYIYRHVLGTDSKTDQLVFHEKDETFSCNVYNSKSKRFIMIASYQTMSTEYMYLDANNPAGEFKVVQPRERGLEYSVEDFGTDFYIVTNLGAKNFRLMKTPVANCGKKSWTEVIPHREDVLLEGIEIFRDFLVVAERKNGLTQLRLIKWADKSEYYIEFSEPAYFAYYHDNLDFATTKLRYSYSSLTTPFTVFEFDMMTKEKVTLKADQVMDKNFKPENYVSERIYAEATDGTLIPISLVYKKGLEKNGTNPLLLYAYGSYGSNTEPFFSMSRLSLLDRGFVYAIAHVRGGQEMGRQWYEDGKLLKKKNTFTDFINCAEYLVAQKYTSPEHLYADGASAGGLLIGAVVNMRPDLWHGVIAGVPFVDVISTMWDESIPLTTGEFDEWGNPKIKEYYDYMLSYSPYDNVEAKAYPNMLVTTGYWDSQVQYWEPAKWVARLRDMKTDKNMLLLSCNMDVGHGGASGRFQRFKEVALEYAFLLSLEGIEE
ncbi:MAG: S9 family peptidase [Bacteroidetes bacterium]|nr:S9 family peptidase [Bacteroidota bacterium]